MEEIFCKNKPKNILIVGVGGGCDIFFAYTFYKYLLSFLHHNVNMVIGNTRRSNKSNSHLIMISEHIYGILSYNLTKIVKTKPHLRLDVELLPHSDNIKVFILPEKDNQDECQELIDEVQFEKWNMIISVDVGGDSLFSDDENKSKDNRDVEMIEVLKSVQNKIKCEYYHIVFGLSSDGEYEEDILIKALHIHIQNKQVIGTFLISNDMYLSLEPFSKYFKDDRTLNIILNNRYNKSSM
jgi:hypothetical protein